jgi:hypothetical protein
MQPEISRCFPFLAYAPRVSIKLIESVAFNFLKEVCIFSKTWLILSTCGFGTRDRAPHFPARPECKYAVETKSSFQSDLSQKLAICGSGA